MAHLNWTPENYRQKMAKLYDSSHNRIEGMGSEQFLNIVEFEFYKGWKKGRECFRYNGWYRGQPFTELVEAGISSKMAGGGNYTDAEQKVLQAVVEGAIQALKQMHIPHGQNKINLRPSLEAYIQNIG